MRRRVRAAASLILLWDEGAKLLRSDVRAKAQEIDFAKTKHGHKLTDEETIIINVDKFLLEVGHTIDELK